MARHSKDILFVSVQFSLFLIYLFRLPFIDFEANLIIRISGLILSIIGLMICLLSLLALNRHLSVFPSPKQNGALIQSGVYKFIRHPIYTGILISCYGFAAYSENGLRLLLSLILTVLFILKARYEESLLAQKFPDYIAYQNKSGMFLPRIRF